MKVTTKQAEALKFIAERPWAHVDEIATAAGASTTGSNGAEFLRRLIDGGLVNLTITPQAADIIGNL